MNTQFTVDYFIDKFSKLNNWCTGIRSDDSGNHCALGHISPANCGYKDETLGDEEIALGRMFLNAGIYYPDWPTMVHGVAAVNNGDHPQYQQPTPKQRILAALRDVKKMQGSQNTVSKEPDVQASVATKPIVAMGWPNKSSSFTNIIEVPDETSDLILNETICE